MDLNLIDQNTISQINAGSESAFAVLYKTYYAYLNAVAIYYLYDKGASQEVVDDVFLNVWDSRESLVYPVHSYLVRAVRNRCLNYIRSQRAQQNVLDGYQEEILLFQENFIFSSSEPFQYVRQKETEVEIRSAIEQLPPRCRAVFEAYFYEAKTAEEIAGQMSLSVNTVRVQIKIALDKLKESLKYLLCFLLLCFK